MLFYICLADLEQCRKKWVAGAMTSVSPHSHHIGMVRECAELLLDSVCLPVCPLFIDTFVNNIIAAPFFRGAQIQDMQLHMEKQ